MHCRVGNRGGNGSRGAGSEMEGMTRDVQQTADDSQLELREMGRKVVLEAAKRRRWQHDKKHTP